MSNLSWNETRRAPPGWNPPIDPTAVATLSLINTKDDLHMYSISGNFVDMVYIEIILIELHKAQQQTPHPYILSCVVLVETGFFTFDKVVRLVSKVLNISKSHGDPTKARQLLGPVLVIDGTKAEKDCLCSVAIKEHLERSQARKIIWHTGPYSRLRSWEFLKTVPIGAIIINDLPHDDEPYDQAIEIKISDLKLLYNRHSGVPVVFIGGGLLLADERDEPYSHLPVFRTLGSTSAWESALWETLDDIALTVFQMQAIFSQKFSAAAVPRIAAPWAKRCMNAANYTREACFLYMDERARSLPKLLGLPLTHSFFPTSRTSTLGCLAIGQGLDTPDLALVTAEYHPSLQKILPFQKLSAEPKTYILTSSHWDKTKERMDDRWYLHIRDNLNLAPKHIWTAWLEYVNTIDEGLERGLDEYVLRNQDWDKGLVELLGRMRKACKEGKMTQVCEGLERRHARNRPEISTG